MNTCPKTLGWDQKIEKGSKAPIEVSFLHCKIVARQLSPIHCCQRIHLVVRKSHLNGAPSS